MVVPLHLPYAHKHVVVQARVQEFARGGVQNLKAFFFFFFCFSIFQGGGPSSEKKIAEKMIFSTKKVAKYMWNSLIFALMTFFFFFCFSISRGGAQAPWAPPWTRACQARVQEFVRGGPKIWKPFFFFAFHMKLAEKMTCSTKKVAKYRWNSLIFVLMTFFFFFFLLFNF